MRNGLDRNCRTDAYRCVYTHRFIPVQRLASNFRKILSELPIPPTLLAARLTSATGMRFTFTEDRLKKIYSMLFSAAAEGLVVVDSRGRSGYRTPDWGNFSVMLLMNWWVDRSKCLYPCPFARGTSSNARNIMIIPPNGPWALVWT